MSLMMKRALVNWTRARHFGAPMIWTHTHPKFASGFCWPIPSVYSHGIKQMLIHRWYRLHYHLYHRGVFRQSRYLETGGSQWLRGVSVPIKRLVVRSRTVSSFWNFDSGKAAILPKLYSDCRAIGQFLTQIMRLRDFSRAHDKKSYRL